MNPGDKVEVNIIWAGSPIHLDPLKNWFKNYIFVRQDGNYGIVKPTKGLYQGLEIRYPIKDIRLEKL